MPLATFITSSLLSWAHRLGGPGLFLVAVVDNSFIPIPGGVDIATILLVSSHREWWIYYGVVATVSSAIGGWLTYRLAKKGGKETLEKKIGKQRAGKVYKKFEKHGFSTIVVGSILPPPFPIVPVLMAPGILKYPTRQFLLALTIGRGIRYLAVAYLAHLYGKVIIGFLAKYRRPMLDGLLVLTVLGAIAAIAYFKYYRPKRRREERAAGEPMEELPVPGQGNQALKEEEESTAETQSKEERKSA